MKLILSICLWALPFLSFAQFSLQGFIVEESEQPLAYANVVLLNAADSSFYKGEVSGEDGSFKIEMDKEADFILQVSLLGFADFVSKPFRIENKNPLQNFPTIILSRESTNLDEVQIIGRKSVFEQKIDRLVVNPQQLLSAAGGTALDILSQSPGVLIDQASGIINLFGKNGVQILINGKSNYLPPNAIVNYLQGIDAASIERVELITTPPAHLDAQGNAGFINIVLNSQQEEGWNGSFNSMLAYGRGEAPNAGLNLFYRAKQWNAYANYSYARYAQDERSSLDWRQNTFRRLVSNKRNPIVNNHNYRLGFDWDLNTKHSIGLSWSGYDNSWNMFANSVIQRLSTEDTTILWSNREINDWTQNQINVHYELKPKAGQKLSLDVDYLNYFNRNPTTYDIRYQAETEEIFGRENLLSDKTTPFFIWVSQLAYQNSINDQVSWSAGVKWARFDFENRVKVELDEVPLDGFNDTSDLLEQIFAAYGSVDYQIHDRLLLKAGLRFEQTQTQLDSEEEGRIVDRDFGNLFPSLFLEYDLRESQKLNFSYTRRVNRPAFSDIAPFIIFQEPNSLYSGNPALQAAFSDQIQVGYQYKSINFSLSYTDESNTIVGFQNNIDFTTNTNFIASNNLAYQRIWMASFSVPITWQNNWETRFFLMLTNVEGEPQADDASGGFVQNNLRLNLNHNMKLAPNWQFEISGFYQTAGRNGNVLYDPLGLLNIAFQHQLSPQSKLSFGINDLLNTRVYSGLTIYDQEGARVRRSFDASQTTFRLGFSTSFGKQSVKKAERRNSSAEEKSRLN